MRSGLIYAPMASTAAAVARALADAGISRVFGLPGGEVLVLMDELRRAGVDFVLMRHEANAGIAAAVYGKLRGQPGVVLTTLGPGAANLMLPIASSALDAEPLLALSAQIPDDSPSGHTHQLLPLHDVYRPVSKFVSRITRDNVRDVVPRALAECMTRPYGPAYLTLSAREALAGVTPSDATGDGRAPDTGTAIATPPRLGNAADKARELLGLLKTARRPLVAIGLGIDPANAPRIRRWVTDWNLPVVVTPKVKGIVDETAANFVGVVSGCEPSKDGGIEEISLTAARRYKMRDKKGKRVITEIPGNVLYIKGSTIQSVNMRYYVVPAPRKYWERLAWNLAHIRDEFIRG